MMCPTVICSIFSNGLVYVGFKNRINPYLLSASLTATAHATVIPTMGLLPAPIRPIISTHSESADKRLFYNIAESLVMTCFLTLFDCKIRLTKHIILSFLDYIISCFD